MSNIWLIECLKMKYTSKMYMYVFSIVFYRIYYYFLFSFVSNSSDIQIFNSIMRSLIMIIQRK